MTANDVVNGNRVAHVRELKAEIARLKEELSATHAELESLRSHFELALAAALDAEHVPEGGRLLIVDGWNALLGSASVLSPDEKRLDSHGKKERLRDLVRATLTAHPLDQAWIVFDGSRIGGRAEPRLHESYTGGEGTHRADRIVCDYLRMRRLVGANREVVVFTEDKDFRREAESLGALVQSVKLLESMK